MATHPPLCGRVSLPLALTEFNTSEKEDLLPVTKRGLNFTLCVFEVEGRRNDLML